MAIAASIIFIWPSTNASIPAGWERETTLDAKYPKGTAVSVDPDVTGGATTHVHTVTNSHTHSLNAHTHTVTVANGSASSTVTGSDSSGGAATSTHNHANNPYTSSAMVSPTVGSSTPSYDAFSNNPPYYEVIFIKPTDPVAGLADDGICFVDSSDTKGMVFCNGSSSTPDLRNKYLKGAATGGNAGGTGGTYTNVHTLTHTHTDSHSHSSITTGAPTAKTRSDAGTGIAGSTHTHSITIPAYNTPSSDTPSITTIETVEPAYEKIVPVQNQTGSTLESVGMIGMWLGSLANIPTGWSEVPRLRGKHLKCANTTSESGTTGGSNTHTHIAQNHTHSLGNHTHTITNLTHVSAKEPYSSGGTAAANTSTVHAVTTSAVALTLGNGSTTANSSNNEPPYRTVAFIKLTNIISGGAFIFSML
jgi:hypothetical protein